MEGEHKPVPFLQTPFNETSGQFSPDGKWMAYASNESGQPQVYVQPIPATGAKWQISAAGGDQPRWRRDAKELFYISVEQKLMAVPVKIGSTFETGSPQALFDIQPIYGPLTGHFVYQPTADGRRFLVLANVGGTLHKQHSDLVHAVVAVLSAIGKLLFSEPAIWLAANGVVGSRKLPIMVDIRSS
jgi:hypothetical protein